MDEVKVQTAIEHNIFGGMSAASNPGLGSCLPCAERSGHILAGMLLGALLDFIPSPHRLHRNSPRVSAGDCLEIVFSNSPSTWLSRTYNHQLPITSHDPTESLRRPSNTESYESVTHKMASNVPSGTFTKAKVLVICLARQSNCSETKHLWTVSTAPGYAVSTITHHAEPCTLRDITHFGNLGAVWRGGTS
ncbi:unnamed protein product [Zymoseptoria tritici ST99CH_3D7]|uniref:Uncharacterized protein n=1 Tax=Zymoseptoria tritici (strain ST99CH_3D7) TaxID=1276538 RepID=A0A1X7S8N0_ZYMT9|nr:unnamed protein product [Zymoseptoria tritici ST99CH_3D7]